ncbi:stabilin-1 [Lates japonicus]|uniref:Stabilin-1 n=1 Tax=Lates japonicus TaxID=270547 RepID=A0AAD3M512_LATJO|nr:stabilin-1 [Lates japonicus]
MEMNAIPNLLPGKDRALFQLSQKAACPGGVRPLCGNHGDRDDGRTWVQEAVGVMRACRGKACELCVAGHHGPPNCTGSIPEECCSAMLRPIASVGCLQSGFQGNGTSAAQSHVEYSAARDTGISAVFISHDDSNSGG